MVRLLPLLILLACKKAAPPASEPAVAPTLTPVPASTAAPSVEQLQAIHRKLSVRDPEPDCAAMEAELDADPVATWLYAVNTLTMPPYAPMRAAGCLITRHPEAASTSLTDWMRGAETQGLARLVLANLDTLPESVAVDVVTAGLAGPLADTVADAARESARPAVRALAP